MLLHLIWSLSQTIDTFYVSLDGGPLCNQTIVEAVRAHLAEPTFFVNIFGFPLVVYHNLQNAPLAFFHQAIRREVPITLRVFLFLNQGLYSRRNKPTRETRSGDRVGDA